MTCFRFSVPASVRASLRLPASKSISNRALIIHALSGGEARLHNLSDCDDTRVMLRALREETPEIDIMAAGTAMRFLTAYFSVTAGERVLTGTERMRQRPIRPLVDALRRLGADIAYAENEGFPPLRIRGGRLNGSVIELRGDVSSQYISALLMIAPMLPHGLTLRLSGTIVSRPYIDLTLHLMTEFGADVSWASEDEIVVGPKPYVCVPFTVESDWSAASYWYQVAALSDGPDIELFGLFRRSHQGDSRGAQLFARLGVRTEFTETGVRLRKEGVLPERMDEDLLDIPDLAQTFVVTCALLGVPFRFTGLQSLRIKETDRLTALRTELGRLGFVIEETGGDTLCWEGIRGMVEENPVIRTYEDHRMAMAFAPACLRFPNLRIADPHVVSKSYPHFWDDWKRAGFGIMREE